MLKLFTIIVAAIVLLAGDTLSAAGLVSHATGGDVPGWVRDLAFGIGVIGAVLSTGALTLADWAKRVDPDGKIKVQAIVELLMQSNEILDDMLWREGNLPTGHRVTVRTSLPTVAWRLLNQGIAPSKSTTAQIDEQAGMLEAWSEVDKDLAELNGDINAFRLSEARAFIEAMNQEFAQTVIYGNGGLAPEEFTGLAPRYSASAGSIADNVIKAGGVGADNTSLWLVAWGEDTVTGIFPKGSKAGLLHEDFGEVTVEVSAGIAGNRMRAYQERFQWKGGIAVKDYRYIVRVCNIDVSDLAGGTPPDLISFMEQASETLPNRLGKPVFYVNRRVRRFLRKQVRTSVANGGGLTFENYDGKRIMMFDNIPIRLVDQILLTEALVP
jgi:hypothetical protein